MSAKEMTNSYRRNAVIIGILFIIATAFLFIGQAVYAPVLDSPDYLETAYPDRIIATIGMLLEFACVLAIPLIPVFLFPVLRKHSETLALGYIVFRFFEAILFVLVEINKLSLINVSQRYLAGSAADASFFQNIGSSLQAWNSLGWLFYILVFAIGALILYTVLYQSRLVPRFLSAWGFIAALMILASALMTLLEVDLNLSGGAFELIFAVPIGVQEMVMAVWLIVKGFNSPVEQSANQQADTYTAARTPA